MCFPCHLDRGSKLQGAYSSALRTNALSFSASNVSFCNVPRLGVNFFWNLRYQWHRQLSAKSLKRGALEPNPRASIVGSVVFGDISITVARLSFRLTVDSETSCRNLHWYFASESFGPTLMLFSGKETFSLFVKAAIFFSLKKKEEERIDGFAFWKCSLTEWILFCFAFVFWERIIYVVCSVKCICFNTHSNLNFT